MVDLSIVMLTFTRGYMFGLFFKPIFEGISPENDQQDHSSKVTWVSLKNIQTPVMSTFKWFPGIKNGIM